MGNTNQRVDHPNHELSSEKDASTIQPEDPRQQFSTLKFVKQGGTSRDVITSTECSDRTEKQKWQRAANDLVNRDLYQYNGAGGDRQKTFLDQRTDLPSLTLIHHDSSRFTNSRIRHDENDHAGPGSLRRKKLKDAHEREHNADSPSAVTNERARNTSAPSTVPQDCTRDTRSHSAESSIPWRTRPQELPGDGKVSEVGVQQLKHLLATSDRPIVIDVYKNGCPGCDALEPTMRNIAAKYEGRASVYRMNVTELARDPELRAQMKISAVPTTFVYENGHLKNRDVGPKDERYYSSILNNVIANRGDHSPSQIPDRLTPDRREKRAEKQHDGHESEEKEGHHGLSARLHKIKEKLARLTHFTHKEREEAFNPTADEIRTMDLINQRRRQHHLPDVVQDPRLQMIARRHTAYQMSHGMTHNESTPGWQNVSQRMSQVGLQGWRENAATGAFTPETLVQMWMDSPPHRAALLGQGNIAAVAIRGGKATFNLTTDRDLY